MNLSFSAKSPYVQSDRWIAQLSDGTTVFQDKIPGEKSAWLRLAEHTRDKKLRITCLQLEAYGSTVLLNNKDVIGWWQSSKIGVIVPHYNIDITYQGIGVVINDIIHIVWIDQDGNLSEEKRTVKSNDLAIIYNEI